MTKKKMRELDEFCAREVTGWQRAETLAGWVFSPTTKPDDALKVLKKCAEKISTAAIEIYQGVDEGPEFKPIWCITRRGSKTVVMAETLELAIALFAKELFHRANVTFIDNLNL